ncbi:MAG: transglycosylase SLT domain-containing protein, partial [Bacteroidota bacterium]
MKRIIFFIGIILLASSSKIFCQNFEGAKRYDDYFRKYSKRFFGIGFDWHVFKAQGIAESNLSPDAKSWVGAVGIMQLMPATYKDIQSALPEMQKID